MHTAPVSCWEGLLGPRNALIECSVLEQRLRHEKRRKEQRCQQKLICSYLRCNAANALHENALVEDAPDDIQDRCLPCSVRRDTAAACTVNALLPLQLLHQNITSDSDGATSDRSENPAADRRHRAGLSAGVEQPEGGNKCCWRSWAAAGREAGLSPVGGGQRITNENLMRELEKRTHGHPERCQSHFSGANTLRRAPHSDRRLQLAPSFT